MCAVFANILLDHFNRKNLQSFAAYLTMKHVLTRQSLRVDNKIHIIFSNSSLNVYVKNIQTPWI